MGDRTQVEDFDWNEVEFFTGMNPTQSTWKLFHRHKIHFYLFRDSLVGSAEGR